MVRKLPYELTPRGLVNPNGDYEGVILALQRAFDDSTRIKSATDRGEALRADSPYLCRSDHGDVVSIEEVIVDELGEAVAGS